VVTETAERILYQTDLREGSQLRVTTHAYRGEQYVRIRLYWNNGTTWVPTKRGVTVNVELLPDIIAALQAADEAEPVHAVRNGFTGRRADRAAAGLRAGRGVPLPGEDG
jgi:hypothetical protein